METFGERLRFARLRARYTQEQVAKSADCTKAMISKAELGHTNDLKMDTLFRVADYLQVDPRWLVTGDPQHSPDESENVEATRLAKDLLGLPADLREPLMAIIQKSAKAQETRFWEWAKT